MSNESINDSHKQSFDKIVLLEPIVLDMGSSLCKVGFAGSQEPCAVFPTVVGRPKRGRKTMPVGQGREEREIIAVGEDARSARCRALLRYPMQRGVVPDWSDMERI